MSAKDEYVIPEHLINVPLNPKHQLRIVARVNAIKLFILESVSDAEAKKEVRDRLNELEEECLTILKEKISNQIKEKPFESRFSTQTSKEQNPGTQSIANT